MARKKITGAFAIWKPVFRLILAEPRVLSPFLILAGIEAIVLWALASSPHFPFNKLLAPPIRSIWGGIYLHYPYIYELLPKLFYLAKIFLSIFVGSVTSGMAILAVFRIHKKEAPGLKEIFFPVLRRYVSLVLLSAALFFLVHFATSLSILVLVKYFRAFMPVLSFFLAAFLQALLVYSLPYVVLREKQFLAGLVLGIRLFFRTALKTFLVVASAMVFYIPVSLLRNSFLALAGKSAPEAVVFVLFSGILAGTVVVGALVTIATTLLFLEAADGS